MKPNRLIPRLLAGRDRLGVVEKDAILDAVLAEVAPPPRRRAWLFALVPAIAAIAAVVLWAPWRGEGRNVAGDLAARGSGAPVAMMRAACGGASVCKRGDKLLFDVAGTTGYRYLAAFGRGSDGTILWYLPGEASGQSADLLTQAPGGVLARGIVVDDAHAEGRVTVYGVFSHAPLTREAIRAAFDPQARTAGGGTAVVATEVEIR